MFDEDAPLASDVAQTQFRDHVCNLLRGGDYAAAEQFILAHARDAGSVIGALSAAIAPGSVSLDGWDDVASMMLYFGENGCPITAIGVDLTENIDGDETPQGCVEPGLEVAYYTEDSYAFAGQSRDTIAAAMAGPGEPDWRGCFEDCSNPLAIHGLAALHSALRDAQAGELPATPGDLLIGWAMLALRFQQAVEQGAAQAGLPAGLVVLTGENEFAGPYIAGGVCILGNDGGDSTDASAASVEQPAPAPSAASEPPPSAYVPLPQVAIRRSPLGFGRKGL